MSLISDWSDPMEAGLKLVRDALLEDNAAGDAATEALGDMGKVPVTCSVNAREELVVAGLPFAGLVYIDLPGKAQTFSLAAEGKKVPEGTELARIQGTASEVLRGERVFLNILGRLCGIATLTREFVRVCSGTGAEILDTRKTTPGMRALEKYAVRTGGGTNHRFSLADMAMIKDNHLAAIGGVNRLGPVMERLRGMNIPVEIEVDTLSQFREVLPFAPDRILLDNMSPGDIKAAVKIADGTDIYLEASGGISLETVRMVAETGVNGISVGALTHSVKCSDIGFDWSYNRSDI